MLLQAMGVFVIWLAQALMIHFCIINLKWYKS